MLDYIVSPGNTARDLKINVPLAAGIHGISCANEARQALEFVFFHCQSSDFLVASDTLALHRLAIVI